MNLVRATSPRVSCSSAVEHPTGNAEVWGSIQLRTLIVDVFVADVSNLIYSVFFCINPIQTGLFWALWDQVGCRGGGRLRRPVSYYFKIVYGKANKFTENDNNIKFFFRRI